MPLSEHEQRLLEQIEASLYAEDPKFARSWRTRDFHSIKRTRLVRAGLLFVVGLGLLLGGVITLNGSTIVGIALGVAGFLLMLGAAWFALSTRQRIRTQSSPKAKGPRQSIKSRLEERWERRQDNR